MQPDPTSPLDLDQVDEDFRDFGEAFARVSLVRSTVARGLLAAARRERDELAARNAKWQQDWTRLRAERDKMKADVESLGHWHCPNCGGGEATDVDDDGAMCATCGHQIEWSEPDVLSRAKAYAAKLRDAKNRAFKERDAARAEAEQTRRELTDAGWSSVADLHAAYVDALERWQRSEPVVEKAQRWRAWLADELDNDQAETDLAAAVDTYETQEGTE